MKKYKELLLHSWLLRSTTCIKKEWKQLKSCSHTDKRMETWFYWWLHVFSLAYLDAHNCDLKYLERVFTSNLALEIDHIIQTAVKTTKTWDRKFVDVKLWLYWFQELLELKLIHKRVQKQLQEKVRFFFVKLQSAEIAKIYTRSGGPEKGYRRVTIYHKKCRFTNRSKNTKMFLHMRIFFLLKHSW